MRAIITGIALSFAVASSHAADITVCASGCTYTSINAAIDAANDGDVIQLSAGTYRENAEINTLGKSITLRGVGDTNGDGAPETVLDGEGLYLVIRANSTGSSHLTIEGLTIRNGKQSNGWEEWDQTAGLVALGYDLTLINTVIESNDGDGVFAQNGTWHISGCTFESNTRKGLYVNNGHLQVVNSTIARNESSGVTIAGLEDRTASDGSTIPSSIRSCVFRDHEGTGWDDVACVIAWNSHKLHVLDCVFTDNTGALMIEWDDENEIWDDEQLIKSCRFERNGSSANYRAAVWVYIASCTFEDCQFIENEGALGGALKIVEYAYVQIHGCLFEQNTATESGGALYVDYSSSMHIRDTTFCNNQAQGEGSVIAVNSRYSNTGGPTTMTNCVMRNNSGASGIWLYTHGGLAMSDSVLCNSGDELIVQEDDDDYSGFENLGANCISMDCQDCDADECTGDINGDGRVDGADLGVLLAVWGPDVDSDNERADLNHDCNIDGTDLTLVLSAWGACP